MKIYQSINNNPRWLWEAVAIYESKRPPVPNPEQLKCFDKINGPSLQNLSSHPLNIYKVGYYLAEYIKIKWGVEGMDSLIKANGDIQDTLEISVVEFESNWHDYMLETYSNFPIQKAPSNNC